MKKILALFLVITIAISGTTAYAQADVCVGAETDTEVAVETIAETEHENEASHIVVIDAGHQMKGDNKLEPIGPGAKEKKKKVSYGTRGNYSKMAEYELTLNLAKKLEKELKKRGYEVIMTRTKNDVNISNSQRAIIANKAKADVYIRIHANSCDNSSVYGANTICMTSKNPYNKSIYKESRKLSEDVIKELAFASGCKNRGVSESDKMTGINWSKVPVTIVEVGYMSNKSDDLKLKTSSYQKKLVQGMANGVDRYFNCSVEGISISAPIAVESSQTKTYNIKQAKNENTSFTIKAKAKVKGDISKKVRFSSSNTSIVKVDKNTGKVKTVANKYGTAVITVCAVEDETVYAKLKIKIEK